ncbi:MAG: hydrogenase maturation nickel metallochaperone HypA [Desulfatitalea sp.]|nr:hydrogenase maturation nickel metallochaperone HypA [Desulfatitalea sp.]NNK00376.1 hydrogenase maturation nickel metallochaperone HypA [Desulfatitalea sp.]
MHSFRTTSWMVNIVLIEAQKRHAKRVARVEVDLGKLVCFNPAQLKSVFVQLLEDTVADNAEIIIHTIDPEIKCNQCGRNGDLPLRKSETFDVQIASLTCPDCGASDVDITKGKECRIAGIGMVLPSSTDFY